METKSVSVDRLRGIWMGVSDLGRTREFYEQIGALFEGEPEGGILPATLAGTRLIFEQTSTGSSEGGPALLFDVADADVLHAEFEQSGLGVKGSPKDEPWGRQFDIRDPDGYLLAFIGPARS